jgi:hypothetical protein
MLVTILMIVFLTFVLNVVIIQSNNFVFMVFKKPVMWIIFMGLLSFVYFFIGSRFNGSFNVVWWSALLAFIVNISPRAEKHDALTQTEKNKIIDEIYDRIGIKNGRLKYKIGLFAYVIGGVMGWALFYGRIVTEIAKAIS